VNWRSVFTDVGVAVAVVAGGCVLIGAVESVGHVSNISNVFIILIAVLASRRGMFAALVASVLSFLAFDWFFIPPVHGFTVNDPSEYVALATLLVTILVIGQLLAVARTRAEEAHSMQRQTQLLYDVSTAALSGPQMADVYPMALWRLNEALGLVGSRLFLKVGADLEQVAASGTVAGGAEEPAWLRQVGDEGRVLAVSNQSPNNVRVGTELDISGSDVAATKGPRISQMYLPLRIESRVAGVLVVGEKRDGTLFTAEDRRLLLAFSNQLAIAVERENFAEQQTRARALEESDRLKSALVSSVSHELKTPLAAIKISATTLLEGAASPDAGVRLELADAINRETDRLTRLVSNLLDMSRLEGGALRPQLEWVAISDVVAEVLDRMEPILNGRQASVIMPEDVPATRMDFVQISQVLTNLLDNAVRYAPPEAAISISAEVVRDQLRATVFNEGTHIPPADLERLFDKFYRLSTNSGGIGLGLSIARGIIEAHHGRIWAENVGQRGVAFSFTIPALTQPAVAPPGPLKKASVA
jgi:two-component system, OmpR family, sensor histidine kinase KdpD